MLFKIEFKNNTIASATVLHEVIQKDVFLEFASNNGEMSRYMYLNAENEQAAAEAASRLFKDIWGDVVNTVGY